jgi:hypothetical protein
MNDVSATIRLPRALLQTEAAKLLRCAPAKIKRLRLARKLGYSRRRPVTISQEELEAYVSRSKVRRVKARGVFAYISADTSPKPFVLLTHAEAGAKFGRTARQIRYLCLQGRIPYIRGRPPLIDEADLADYLESKRLAALAKIPPAPGTPEFDALQDRKARARMVHRLRVKAIKRKVARILAAGSGD